MRAFQWVLLASALPKSIALCATQEACQVLAVALATVFIVPLSLLHHALSMCVYAVRRTAQAAAVLTVCGGVWTSYAIVVSARIDLVCIPALWFATAAVHVWMAQEHAADRRLLFAAVRARFVGDP